jgi:NAD(P)-dependent dehydrogenase (short-subunit alcohol dehydrogenase family)
MSAKTTPFGLRNATALITGANRGLGKCFVDGLIRRGVSKIYACARTPDTLQPLLDLYGSTVVPIELDVTNQDQVDDVVKAAGDVSLLINNAGVLSARGLIQSGTLDNLQFEMDVNVFGLARMCQGFAPVLKQNGGGAILNILSVASLYAFAPFGTYAASKAAAMSLTQSIAYELRDQGTSVFGTYAGYIDTGMIDHLDGEKTAPEDIVAASLDGIENGISEIDADHRAEAIRALRNQGGDDIRQAYWARADDFNNT